MKKSTEQQITTLFVQAMRTALAIIDEKQPSAPPRLGHTAVRELPTGIYPHKSKYNPWRAYVWDKTLHKSIYIGAFPSINKAKAAQTAFRKGQPLASGTKTLQLVKAA